jgi:hypothetical protein
MQGALMKIKDSRVKITNEVLARLNGDWTTDAAGSGSRLRAKGRGL